MSGAWLWGSGGVAAVAGWFYIGWCSHGFIKGWATRRNRKSDTTPSD